MESSTLPVTIPFPFMQEVQRASDDLQRSGMWCDARGGGRDERRKHGEDGYPPLRLRVHVSVSDTNGAEGALQGIGGTRMPVDPILPGRVHPLLQPKL